MGMSSASNYSFGARLLHCLALGSDSIAQMAFDLDRLLFQGSDSEDPACERGSHVFIAGLARAGTTLLMRLIYQTGDFCSLTYRDMPFVTAPNLWRKLRRGSELSKAAEERAHADGLLVDFDSPEALEEVFWRVFCGKYYIAQDHLATMDASDALVDQFRHYIKQILKSYGGCRYLSKNNNNMLRFPSIRRAFPEAIILVPFRNPLGQASSLLRQHMHFKSLQVKAPFVRRYMRWLVHHEFGADHRPFEWAREATSTCDDNTLEYWLSVWYKIYSALLLQLEDPALALTAVNYDHLCAEPENCWAAIAKRVGIAESLPEGLIVRRSSAQNAVTIDGELMEQPMALYDKLIALSRRQ